MANFLTSADGHATPRGGSREVSALPCLLMAEPAPAARRIAKLLGAMMIALPLAMALLPWRQSVPGVGRVAAYAPLDRRTMIEAPIPGRIAEWYVAEGAVVRKGDNVARISDNDTLYMTALESQRVATEQKLATASAEVALYDSVTERFLEVRTMSVRAAEAGLESARQKVAAEEQEKAGTQATSEADRIQADRMSRLIVGGLASRRDWEQAEQKARESSAKFLKAQAGLKSAMSDVQAKEAYLEEIKSKTQADIQKCRAEAQKGMGKVAECNKELQDISVKIRRQGTQTITAPRDGTILRLMVSQGTEQVKEGDVIAILVPDTTEMAVELLLDGNDAPLIHVGDQARLQFEGWPAVQFAGWPSVAVGTFAGRVALVDSSDDGKGKFRIMIRPEPGQKWPSSRYLRQGVRAKGWVLLGEVRLGYEFWRRLNGFPQAVGDAEPKSGDDGGKEKVKTKRPKE